MGNNILIVKNTIYMTIRMIFVLIISLYTTRVVLAQLGVLDYGIFNVVGGFVAMFTFLNNAITSAVQRYYNYEIGRNDYFAVKEIYNTSIIVQIVMAIIVIIISEAIGIWYVYNKLNVPTVRLNASFWILQSSIASFVIMILQVPYSALIVAKEKMGYFAIVSVIHAILSLIIAYVLSISNFDKLILYGFLLTLVNFICFCAYYVYCKNNFKEVKYRKGFNLPLFKSMSIFSGWNSLGAFAWAIKEQGVNIMLNIFCGPIVNSARGIAMQVNSGFQSLVSNIGVTVRPQITQSYAQGNIARTIALTFSFSKFSCVLLYMFSLPILLELNYVLGIWLGDSYPEHTKAFIIIIVITSFLSNLNSAVSSIVHSTGIIKKYQLVGSFLNLMSLPFVYFVLYKGARAEVALIVILFSMIAVQIGALIVLKSIVNYSIMEYLKQVVGAFFLTVAVSIGIPIIIYIIMPQGIIRFIIVAISSLITVSITFYFLGMSKAEKELTKGIFVSLREKMKTQKVIH